MRGFTDEDSGESVPPRTAWDLAELLIVPLVLVALGFGLTSWQARRDVEAEAGRIQNEALASYLNDIERLVLEEDLLHAPTPIPYGSNTVQELARAKTTTVLRSLDAPRRGHLLVALSDLGLLETEEPLQMIGSQWAIISLHRTDLRGVVFPRRSYINMTFTGIDMSNADVRDTDGVFQCRNCTLDGSRFDGSDLRLYIVGGSARGLSLRNAKIAGKFEATSLVGSDFRGADVSSEFLHVDVSTARFSSADLSSATLYDGAIGAIGLSQSQLQSTSHYSNNPSALPPGLAPDLRTTPTPRY